jgi:hypothetical protein
MHLIRLPALGAGVIVLLGVLVASAVVWLLNYPKD